MWGAEETNYQTIRPTIQCTYPGDQLIFSESTFNLGFGAGFERFYFIVCIKCVWKGVISSPMKCYETKINIFPHSTYANQTCEYYQRQAFINH